MPSSLLQGLGIKAPPSSPGQGTSPTHHSPLGEVPGAFMTRGCAPSSQHVSPWWTVLHYSWYVSRCSDFVCFCWLFKNSRCFLLPIGGELSFSCFPHQEVLCYSQVILFLKCKSSSVPSCPWALPWLCLPHPVSLCPVAPGPPFALLPVLQVFAVCQDSPRLVTTAARSPFASCPPISVLRSRAHLPTNFCVHPPPAGAAPMRWASGAGPGTVGERPCFQELSLSRDVEASL